MLFLLTVSLAASKAGAAAKGIPLWKHYAEVAGNPVPYTLPVPCFNVINGGEHAGNKLPFQEFFVIPTGAADFTESMISEYQACEIIFELLGVFDTVESTSDESTTGAPPIPYVKF